LPAKWPVHPTRFYRLDNFSRASALLQRPRFNRRFAAPSRWRRSNANRANEPHELPAESIAGKGGAGLMNEPSVRAFVGARLPANWPVHPTHFCRLYRLFAGKRALRGCVLAECSTPAKRPGFGLTRHTPDLAPASVRSRAGLAVCARCSFRPDPCRLYRRRSTAPADGRSTSR